MRSIYLLVALLSLSNGFPVSPSGDYITAPEDNGFPVSQSNGYLVASGDESHAAGWQLGEGGRNFDGRYSPLSPEERAREGRLRRQKQLELDDQRRLNKQQEEEARNREGTIDTEGNDVTPGSESTSGEVPANREESGVVKAVGTGALLNLPSAGEVINTVTGAGHAAWQFINGCR